MPSRTAHPSCGTERPALHGVRRPGPDECRLGELTCATGRCLGADGPGMRTTCSGGGAQQVLPLGLSRFLDADGIGVPDTGVRTPRPARDHRRQGRAPVAFRASPALTTQGSSRRSMAWYMRYVLCARQRPFEPVSIRVATPAIALVVCEQHVALPVRSVRTWSRSPASTVPVRRQQLSCLWPCVVK